MAAPTPRLPPAAPDDATGSSTSGSGSGLVVRLRRSPRRPPPPPPPRQSRIPAELGEAEKLDLLRIWNSNKREVLHVRSTLEAVVTAASSGGGGGGGGGGFSNHGYGFAVRLYRFFLAFLNKAIVSESSSSSSSLQQQQQNAPGSSTTKDYLKDVNQSCLREFLRLVVVAVDDDDADDESENDDDDDEDDEDDEREEGRRRSRRRLVVVVLPKGRHVIGLPHDRFLSELNEYELKGMTCTTDFVRRDSFGAFLYHRPAEALAALGVASRLAILTSYKTQLSSQQHSQQQQRHHQNEITQFLDNSQFVVRFVQRVEPKLPLNDIKTGLVGKFVSVVGYVVKAKPKRLRVSTADFACQKCGSVTTHAFYNGENCNNEYSPMPTKCLGGSRDKDSKCMSRSFTLIRPTARYVSVQELRLQEAPEESSAYAGRTPRQITVLLTQDLVDCCRPGDTVCVAAIVAAEAVEKQRTNAGNKRGRNNNSNKGTTYSLYLQGHSISTMSESNGSDNGDQRSKNSFTSTVYSQQQLQSITQLCHADHRCFSLVERRAFPFDLLVRSVCPAIIGHYAVKAGLLLCLLGGTLSSSSAVGSGEQQAASSDREQQQLSIRSNSHILIVGDPGMGKSQMLLAASQLAARSVYVGGNTSSTTGLTVTLTKEERGEPSIEAGALVLADQGTYESPASFPAVASLIWFGLYIKLDGRANLILTFSIPLDVYQEFVAWTRWTRWSKPIKMVRFLVRLVLFFSMLLFQFIC